MEELELVKQFLDKLYELYGNRVKIGIVADSYKKSIFIPIHIDGENIVDILNNYNDKKYR